MTTKASTELKALSAGALGWCWVFLALLAVVVAWLIKLHVVQQSFGRTG